VTVVALTGLGIPAARAQISLGVGVGAVGSSNLVADSIVEPLAVRPRIAPQLAVCVATALSARYRVAAELAVSRSGLMAHGDTSTRITGLTLWAPTVGLEAAATPWLGVEARIGALIYDPGDTQGTLFSQGAPVTPLVGIGLRTGRGLGGGIVGSLHLRYDVHRFTTSQLQARGFSGQTVVHRVALTASLHRSLGRAAARR
jgi:hypothetical protein